MPPCTAGWSVFTRPSSISGNPVRSETLMTARPAPVRVRAVPPVDTRSKPRRVRPCAKSSTPVLSETLSKALGIITKVQYHFYRRWAGLAPQGKGRKHAAFFFGSLSSIDARPRHSKQEEERCASQARSNGSTTPRAMDSSNATEAAMSSSTIRPFRVTVSGRSRKVRRWSSRSLTVRRARRPATSPRSNPSWLMVGSLPAPGRQPSGILAFLHTPAFQRPGHKVHFSIFHRHTKRDFRTAGRTQFLHLRLHELGELMKRHLVGADFLPRFGE